MFDLSNKDVLDHFINDFLSNNFENCVSVDNISSHRYRSWEICRSAFLKYEEGLPTEEEKKEEIIDYLALQLAFYLASWGMYRGSSFLLYLDYTIHKKTVEILLDENNRRLFKADILVKHENNHDDFLELLFGNDGRQGIKSELGNHYFDWRKQVNEKKAAVCDYIESEAFETKNELSDVLITKILMGVYGCIPAYDRYVCEGLGIQGICKTFSKRGVKELLCLMKENTIFDSFDDIRRSISEKYPSHQFEINDYTYMKIMDMVLWGIGAGGIVVFKKACQDGLEITEQNYNKVFEDLKASHPSTHTVYTNKGSYTSTDFCALMMCVLSEDIKINKLNKESIKKEISELEKTSVGDVSQNYTKISI